MNTIAITYCVNRCKIRSGEVQIRAQADSPSKFCRHCEDRLIRWLKEIPDHYALLPTFAMPGSAEKNPDSSTTKAAFVPSPVRLDVLDLLDSRVGRMWKGTAPAHDRRGAIGTLVVLIERLVDERPLTPPTAVTVTSACSLLTTHRMWLAEQDWADLFYADLKQLHRALSEAVGIFRRPPVGRCHIVYETTTETEDCAESEAEVEDEPKACGGPLHPNDYGGVRCARCGNTWGPEDLRILGMAQNDTAREASTETA